MGHNRKNARPCFFVLMLFLLSSLMSCNGLPGGPMPPISQDDPCAENLRRLQQYDTTTAVSIEVVDLGKCTASCSTQKALNELLGKSFDLDACLEKCKNDFDVDKIANNFVAVSDEENQRLQQINQEIERLQTCRDQEADSIRNELKQASATKDAGRRKTAMQNYQTFKQKIQDDNKRLDCILANSGKRIKDNEKAGKDAKLFSETSYPKLAVRSGYNIRNGRAGQIIGKTKGGQVEVQEVENNGWVRIVYGSNFNAYVHKKAFPSITPEVKAQAAHAQTKQEYKTTEHNTNNYKAEMDENLSLIDAMIASS